LSLVLTELDDRHFRTVTLAVAGLQNARVAAGPRGELRSERLEQLVRRLTLLDVADGKPASVPVRAFVMSFSMNGRSSLAFASVVSMRSLSMSEVARLRIRASFCSLVRRSCRPAFR
jgi:hypothetical protein